MSLIIILKNNGPKIEPCGIPVLISNKSDSDSTLWGCIIIKSSGLALVIKTLTMQLVAEQTSVLWHHANSMSSYLNMLFLSLRVCTNSSFALLKNRISFLGSMLCLIL